MTIDRWNIASSADWNTPSARDQGSIPNVSAVWGCSK
jgi:hypothetical protein